jgi:hypothetical protein
LEVFALSEPLITYLNDHLAGAQIAVELLEAMRNQHQDERFRNLANDLLPQIEADNRMLRSISENIGTGPNVVKQAGGWILEKLARLKLGHTDSTGLEMFESLEMLALGIHGKFSLWKALHVAAKNDSRLEMYDFDQLAKRAQQQYNIVEIQRLDLARTALSPADNQPR